MKAFDDSDKVGADDVLLHSCPQSCMPNPVEGLLEVFEDMVEVLLILPMGSTSRGGDVTVYVLNINQPSLPAPFYSVLASISVFIALSPTFHSIILPTVLRFLTLFSQPYFCLTGPFNCIYLY